MEVAFGTARVEIGAQSFPRSHLWWIFPSVVNILLPAGLATAPWFALAPQGPMPMDGTFQGSTGLPDIRRIELGNYHRYRNEAMGDPVYALFDFWSGPGRQVSCGPTSSYI